MNEKNLVKDELIGRHVTITKCTDPKWVSKKGVILDETKNTFLIKTGKQHKKIAKKIATFAFEYEGNTVEINGLRLTYRPEDRIKKAR